MPEYTRTVQHPLPCAVCDKHWLLVTGTLMLDGPEVPVEEVQAAIADRKVEVVGASGGTPVCRACRGGWPAVEMTDLPPGLEFALNEWRLQSRFLRSHLEGMARGHHEAMLFIAKNMGHRGPRYDLELYVRRTLLEFEEKRTKKTDTPVKE